MKNIQVQDSYALEALTIAPPASPGAGATGAAPVVALTHAALLARRAAGALVPGQQYRLTARPNGTTLGTSGEVLVTATAPDALAPEATLCAHVPDYTVPLWRTNYFTPGPALGVSYTQQSGPYVPVLPRFFDAVDRHVVGDDSITPAFALPFAFTFGGVAYTQAQIDTNGRLVFGPGPAVSSNNQQRLGSADLPMVAFAWCDLVVTSATFSTFVTGEAPNRRFVLDYQHARRYQRSTFGGTSYDTQDVTTGQLVLAESTNCVTIGVATNLNPDPNVVQGIQYAGHGYNLYEGQRLPDNVLTTFTPVVDRGAPSEVVVPASRTVVWKGATWTLAAGATANAEPGTSPDWAPAPDPAADAFGNGLRTYDAIRYVAETDTIAERRDAAGNCVRGGSLATFPWGHPGVRANTLLDTTLDASLLTTPDLTFAANTLVDCTLARLNLAGVPCTNNQLYGVSLRDYAPTQLDHVTAYYGFDQGVTAAQHQVFVRGEAVRSVLPELEAGLAAFKDKFLTNTCITYRAGQAPSYAPLDIFDTANTDYTPHDLVVLRGVTASALVLRNQNYTIRGEGAVCGSGFFGASTTGPRRITIDGVAFTGTVHVFESNADGSGRGHEIHILNSPAIQAIGVFQGAGNGALDRHTFTNCHIGLLYREAAYNGTYGHQVRLDRCTIGRGLKPTDLGRSALLDTYDGGTLSLLVSNSVFYLGEGMSLEPAGRHSAAPYLSLENCSVVYGDGTVKSLSTSAPAYLLDTTRHAADVAALTDPSHWNTAGNGEYTGPACQFAFPAYYEAPASAGTRAYRYVLDGQGHASRYAGA